MQLFSHAKKTLSLFLKHFSNEWDKIWVKSFYKNKVISILIFFWLFKTFFIIEFWFHAFNWLRGVVVKSMGMLSKGMGFNSRPHHNFFASKIFFAFLIKNIFFMVQAVLKTFFRHHFHDFCIKFQGYTLNF